MMRFFLCPIIKKKELVYKLLRSIKRCNYSRPSFTYLDLLKASKMRRITLLTVVLQMMASLVFDTTARNVTNLNFNIYTSFFTIVALELPADLLSNASSNYIGRSWSTALGLFATGGSKLICAAIVGKSFQCATMIFFSSFFLRGKIQFF